MKKLFILGLLLVLAGTAFGEFSLSAGVTGGFAFSSWANKLGPDSNNYAELTFSDQILTFGAFIDATYINFAGSFGRSIGTTMGLKVVSGGVTVMDDSEDSPDDYYINLVNLRLLGKYPIALGNIKIWPTAGIMYSLVLSMDFNADGVEDDLSDVDSNDFYLVAGCGLDIFFTDNIYLNILPLFNLNLTPIRAKDYEPATDESFFHWIFSAEVGLGFKF